MEMVFAVIAGACLLAALFFFVQWNSLKKLPPKKDDAGGLEKKVEALKAELQASKEELNRKQRALEDARDEAKKKARREGKRDQREQSMQENAGPDPRDVEIQGLKKGLASLEQQLNAAKRELAEHAAAQAGSQEQGASAAQAREADATRSRALGEENVALKRTLDELRHAKRKEQDRPDVPGTSLDLKSLAPEAVQELARYFRKGEEFERLYSVGQGQLQLERDRFQELQRRYFAVCRELALAAGQPMASDAEARKTAESVVDRTDGARQEPRPAGQAPAVAGAVSADGDAPKKRRRRRRRRKPGAPADGALAADGAAGADGGAEGADDGDDGDDGEDSTPNAVAPAGGGDDGGAAAPAS